MIIIILNRNINIDINENIQPVLDAFTNLNLLFADNFALYRHKCLKLERKKHTPLYQD